MNVTISGSHLTKLDDVPEDEQLVVYNGLLCIKDGRTGLYTIYGEILDSNSKTLVQRIKSIKVEI